MLTPLKKNKNLFLVLGVVLIAFLLGFFSDSLFSSTGGAISGAAGNLANQAACNTSSLSNTNPTGIVLADPLNLRTGPGLNYQVITMLNICTSVSLTGRSSDSAWLQVSLPGNVGGWVFAGYKEFPYLKMNVSISDLAVTTASGGPTTNPSSGGSRYVSVIIQGSQVAAFINGMPANANISATLSPSDGAGKSVAVANGKADAQGNLTLTFPMPTTWSDGTPVKSGTLLLTLTGGGAPLTTWVTYYTN